ncbi:MAG: NAD(P)/FAD-dependent oxidoreductase [Bacillota bacterium]|nr:NAD(P)/FAD-dependent oxidoreductase [Bacillota bacterium]
MKEIIIIGSGFGGLVTGNLLAQKGHKVTIFESHSMHGGYTAGFYRNGFYFESGTLSFEASSSVFKAMKDIGVYDKIEFVRQKLRFVSENFDGIPDTYENYKNIVYKGFPDDKDKLDAYFSEVDKIDNAFGSPDKPLPFLFSGFPYLLSIIPFIFRGRKLMKVMNEYRDVTLSEFAARFFPEDSQLYRIFRSMGYPDASAYLSAISALLGDYWTVKNGMQSWADVLADNFIALGGEIKLNAYVDGIITNNGKAVGVSCNGKKYNADYVVSACDYKKTLLKLLDDKKLIPLDMQKKVENAPVSEGFFTVYLGLGMSNEDLSKYIKTPHVSLHDEQPGCDIYNSCDEEFFNKTSLTLYSPSMVNPKHAPSGKSSLMLQTLVPYKWMQNWGNGDRKKYKELKAKATEAIIGKASKLIPDLKNYIEYCDSATPLTYERFTHNTDGASSSWSWNPKKKFYEGGFMTIKVDTPVKNLYIGSCWAMQIGGIPGALAAAYSCAKKIK